MTLKKFIFILLGTISLAFGVTAIFIPGLPTTPFLLLTAWLYTKSSERLYRWLISSRLIGPYILEFKKNKGMTRRTKIQAIGTMWVMITISTLFLIDGLLIKLILVALGIVGTVVMGWMVRTVKDDS
jgi:hypothetical protein